MSTDWELYMGTILLEPTRHATPKAPSYQVSDWAARLAEAGFDGMELWEYHATLCTPAELAALEALSLPVAVFNSYATMDDAGRQDRARATSLAKRLGAKGIKFNVGKDPAERQVYLANIRQWRAELPEEIRLLCECHPGSLVEEPLQAKAFFQELDLEGWGIIADPLSRFESLQDWFDALGPHIVHAHLQQRQPDRTIVRFDRLAERAKEAVRIMRAEGFTGSCTFEFTEGANAPGENIDLLFDNALIDLAFMKEIMAS